MSLLITIEGIDGSGKTTLLKNLKNNLELDLITHNWRDTELGQKIWSILNEAKIRQESNLSSAWSYIFLILVAFDELGRKVIEPNLSKRKTVIIDRYIDSTFVYQGLAGNININSIQEIAQKTINLSLPDLTFILDIEPQQAQERLQKRRQTTGEQSNWDQLNLEFHQKIRNYYLELQKHFPERIIIIDANKSEKEIAIEVGEIISQAASPKKDLPSFARVVIHNEKGELLLVKDKKWGWNLPGGRIEKGETPAEAAKREVFEETNLVLENYQKIGERNVFYANLAKGNQLWKGYFYQADKYSGEIQIKELEKILAIKFFAPNSPEIKEKSHSYQFYLDKIRKITSKYII